MTQGPYERLKTEDPKVLSEIDLEYRDRTVGALGRVLPELSVGDRHELFSEALEELWKQREKWQDGESKPGTMLYRIASRRGQDRLKTTKRAISIEGLQYLEAKAGGSEGRVGAKVDPEIMKAVNSAIETVGDPSATILRMDSATPSGKAPRIEISKATGIPVGQVSTYRRRARKLVLDRVDKKVRELLGRDE